MGQYKNGKRHRSAQFGICEYVDQVIKGIGERNSVSSLARVALTSQSSCIEILARRGISER